MKKNLILIRDDDVSYFTDPATLRKVHGPLLDRNLPVNIAVIPQVRSDIRGDSPDRIYFRQEGLEYEPFIPPVERGLSKSHRLDENSELCSFLRSQRYIEVLQHGFEHVWKDGKPEFASADKARLGRSLTEGKSLIRGVLGKEPSFFVPPWDAVSREAVETVGESFAGISLKEPRRKLFPLIKQFKIRRSRISGRCLWAGDLLLAGHPGYIVTRFNSPEYIRTEIRDLLKREKVITLVVHHWEFFFDWAKPDEKFLSVWHEVLDGLIGNPDVEFVTFSGLYNILKNE